MWRVIQRQQMFQKPFQSTNSKPPDCTRIVCISDTHGRHRSFSLLPPGDILIHAGDFTLRGELAILQDISDYFGKLSESFSEIIVIAGNHDKILHREYYLSRAKGPTAEEEVEEALQVIRKNCVYLHDASYKTSSGLQVYGSPWAPEYCGWAFMLDRDVIGEKWRNIPSATDIVITHGPPLGRGDYVDLAGNVGCYELLKEIQERIKPRVSVFGHVHEGYGTTFDGETLYVNASSVDLHYVPNRHAIVIDVPHDQSKPAMVVPPAACDMNVQDLVELCDANGWSTLQHSLIGCDWTNLQQTLPDNFSLVSDEAFTLLSNSLSLEHQGQMELLEALTFAYARCFPPL